MAAAGKGCAAVAPGSVPGRDPDQPDRKGTVDATSTPAHEVEVDRPRAVLFDRDGTLIVNVPYRREDPDDAAL